MMNSLASAPLLTGHDLVVGIALCVFVALGVGFSHARDRRRIREDIESRDAELVGIKWIWFFPPRLGAIPPSPGEERYRKRRTYLVEYIDRHGVRFRAYCATNPNGIAWNI